MKFRAMVPDPVIGTLIPYRGAADIAIEFEAVDQADANRLARANQLPPAVIIVAEDDPLPKLAVRSARWWPHRHGRRP